MYYKNRKNHKEINCITKQLYMNICHVEKLKILTMWLCL